MTVSIHCVTVLKLGSQSHHVVASELHGLARSIARGVRLPSIRLLIGIDSRNYIGLTGCHNLLSIQVLERLSIHMTRQPIALSANDLLASVTQGTVSYHVARLWKEVRNKLGFVNSINY